MRRAEVIDGIPQVNTRQTDQVMRAIPSAPDGAVRRPLQRKPQADFLLTITVIGLVLFGIVMVFSASYYSTINSKLEDPYYYLIQASKWAVGGMALMLLLSYVPYRLYYKFAPALMILGVLLLCALFVPGVGVNENNATRWIAVGPITIMPGEIAKVSAIFFVAWFFTKNRAVATSFRYAYLPMMVLTCVYFVLIYKQPNLSTAIIVCGIVAVLTCIAGSPKRYLALTVAMGFAGVYALIQSDPTGEHFKRFTGFLDPFSDPQGAFYQTVQALLALGAGGVTGVGPGRSIQKALYLPYAQNDFIFAIIGEEFGFLGCLAILCAFLFLIWRCALVAVNARDRFGMLIASGVTVWISLQVTMNIAVVTSLMPPTGVTLPFISYGGNAVIITMAAMGVMLNISRESAKAAAAETAEETEDEADEEYEASGAFAAASHFGGYKENTNVIQGNL
ncbi:MAG: putative lipid II flippase FtsW [Clostridiales Family XIII bacterium]|jgi:cell division protein FtsW|nr:putative lipid II flippase FtsW [Clostridiales Family XIII bacterium]